MGFILDMSLLKGWRPWFDSRTTAYTVPAGITVDLIPRSKKPGWINAIEVALSSPFSTVYYEGDDVKFGFNAYYAHRVYNTIQSQAQVIWCSMYDSMHHWYVMLYSPTLYPQYQRWIHIYLRAADKNPVTKVPIAAPTVVYNSFTAATFIEDEDLFKQSLSEVYGVDRLEALLKGRPIARPPVPAVGV